MGSVFRGRGIPMIIRSADSIRPWMNSARGARNGLDSPNATPFWERFSPLPSRGAPECLVCSQVPRNPDLTRSAKFWRAGGTRAILDVSKASYRSSASQSLRHASPPSSRAIGRLSGSSISGGRRGAWHSRKSMRITPFQHSTPRPDLEASPERDFLPEAQLLACIRKERHRSDRSGATLALVSLRLPELQDSYDSGLD